MKNIMKKYKNKKGEIKKMEIDMSGNNLFEKNLKCRLCKKYYYFEYSNDQELQMHGCVCYECYAAGLQRDLEIEERMEERKKERRFLKMENQKVSISEGKEGVSEVIGVSYQVTSTGKIEKGLPVLHSFGETEENCMSGMMREILVHPKKEEAVKLAARVAGGFTEEWQRVWVEEFVTWKTVVLEGKLKKNEEKEEK
ncbi:MAG: hypothetical protein WC309_04685 [Candidatus Paceibacterota bacterium]|jgi:hypothetical protein